MAITHHADTRNALADAILAAIDAGASAGTLRIYDTGRVTILAELTLSDPAGTVSGPTLTYAAITDDSSANATGTAAEFAVLDSDANEVYYGSVTGTGGGGDLTLSTTSIVSGQPVEITSLTYTASS